jgi:hypothetical protein
MEMLEDRIKAFVSLSSGYGSGYGSGDGSGDGSGYGYGYGDCSGYGSGSGDGSGDGSGYGYGYGDCSGYGSGSGDGSGDGSGYGYGSGYGDGDGVKDINGNHVYIVDGIQTIIKSVRGNIAQGFVLQSDLTLKPCYVLKEQNKFAHGDTLHDAFTALQEKLYDDSTEEERIEAFRKKFPKYDTPYPNRDLFAYHHVLTGSCRMGRESFCKDKGIDLDGSTTIREFIELTKGSYGGDVICKLPEVYGVK